MTAEKELKIISLKENLSKLNEIKESLEKLQHEMSEEIDNCITEAIIDIDDAISKADDEIKELGG